MSTTDRPFSAVLQEIVRDIQDILRSEIHLAKTEVREELTKTRSAGVLIALGAVSGFFAVLFALLTVVFTLSLVMPVWGATLCVAAGAGIVASVAIHSGLTRIKAIHAGAPKTVASMKENVEWAKQQIK